MKELIWLRNYVIAPISEEFTFRACMLALIIHCTNPLVAVFICPIFFGAAHLHHMIEQMRFGVKWNVALATSCKKLILKMTSNGSFKLMNCVCF
jgi:prenyl protein peptidase